MIELDQVCIQAGAFRLTQLNLRIEQGEYAVLMGRTGRGKSTILEAICGLRLIQAGEIRLDHIAVSNLPPGERQIGYVPQDLALFPTMTVSENLVFALHRRRWKKTQIQSRLQELFEVLGIGHLRDRHPAGLSGGEAQRVAIGRAVSFHPRVLLLDEPLSALDEATRAEMHQLLKQVQQQTGMTTLHVTHSQQEASLLADRLFVLDEGRIVEPLPSGSNSIK